MTVRPAAASIDASIITRPAPWRSISRPLVLALAPATSRPQENPPITVVGLKPSPSAIEPARIAVM